MPVTTSRRAFLAGVAALAAGCSGLSATPGSVPTSAPDAPFGALRFQLGWIRNAQFAGTYAADRLGLFRDVGFESVTLLAGGPTVDPHGPVLDGSALLATSSAELVAQAVGDGAPLKVIAAGYQQSPFVVSWLEEAIDIRVVGDLANKRVAVPDGLVATWELAVAQTSIPINDRPTIVAASGTAQELFGGDADAVVTIGFGLPSELRIRGNLVGEIGLAEMGIDTLDHLYVATAATVDEFGDRLRAALVAERRGWAEVFARPEIGARLTTEIYGADLGLEPDIVHEELRGIAGLMESEDAAVLSLQPDRIAATITTLNSLGHDIDAGTFVPELLG